LVDITISSPTINLELSQPVVMINNIWMPLETDLCTVDDVRLFLKTDNSIKTSEIVKNIRKMSITIPLVTEGENLTRSTPCVRMACVYGVLLNLSDDGLIDDTINQINSFSDGDFSVSFDNTKKSNENSPTNISDMYEYYIECIKELVHDFIVIDDEEAIFYDD